MADTDKNLHSRLQQLASNESGKSKIGYTVSGYDQVMSALMNARTVIENQIETVNDRVGPQGQDICLDYSKMLNDKMNSATSINGFLYVDKQPVYQGVVMINDFMSFPITQKNETKAVKVHRPNVEMCDSVCLTKMQPPCDLCMERVKHVSKLLGGENNPFKIGVGVDLSTFGVKFFSTYFKDFEWTHHKLKQLVSNEKVFAEVSVASGNSNASIFHAMVTCDIGDNLGGTVDNQRGGTYQLWLPFPLLLLDDYKELSVIKITGDNGFQTIGANIKYPLSGEKYNHKKGIIYNFTPNWVLNNFGFSGAYMYEHVRNSLKGNEARIRLYLDQSAKQLFSDLPNDEQLYKGKYNVSDKFLQYEQGGYSLKGGYFFDIGHVAGSGAKAIDGNNEHHYNTLIAHQVAKKVTAAGINVRVVDYEGMNNGTQRTRVRDEFLNNHNDFFAFISFHCNSYSDNNGNTVWDRKSGGGSQVYIWGGKNRHALSEQLGNELARSMAVVMSGSKARSSAIAETSRVGILSKMVANPAVLLECAFMNHLVDVNRLKDGEIFDKFTSQIANTLIQFYNKHKSQQ